MTRKSNSNTNTNNSKRAHTISPKENNFHEPLIFFFCFIPETHIHINVKIVNIHSARFIYTIHIILAKFESSNFNFPHCLALFFLYSAFGVQCTTITRIDICVAACVQACPRITASSCRLRHRTKAKVLLLLMRLAE